MENQLMEVRFDLYCRKCKYKQANEYKDPCNECLESPLRANSRCPLYFEKGAAKNAGQ